MDQQEKLNAAGLHLEQELQIQDTGNVPTAAEKTFTKTTGHADMRGELYEVKVAALLFGRALNMGGGFHLASNMKAAGALDDIVLRLGQITMFLQLKHRTGIGMINKSQLLKLRGKFSLLKYYKSYCEMRQQWGQNEDLQHCGKFEDAIFVIYTNSTIDPSIVTRVDTTGDWCRVLNSGAGTCHSFIEQSNPDIYEFLNNVTEYIKILNDGSNGKKHKNLLATVRSLLNNNCKSLPSHEELRKMLNELPSVRDESDHNEFLSRLYFFTGQASEEQLDDLIREEIKTAIGKYNIYEKFLAGIKNWWMNSNYFLTATAAFLLEIRAGIISEPKLQELGIINLTFRRDVLDRLKAMLPPVGGFLHIITDTVSTTAITSLKVHQSLADECHLFMDVSMFYASQSEVLALWGSWCDLLVVVDDGQMLADFLHPHPGKRLVYISGSAPRDTCTILHDQPDLKQLDDASRDRVLAKLVRFQGYDVPLGEIAGSDQHLVSPDVIVQLLTDKPVLGDDLTNDIGYYVPRTLRLSCEVRDEVLYHRSTDSSVTFVVSGLSHNELQQLVSSGREIETLDNHFPGYYKCKVQIISTEDDFLKMTESCETVHWLHREGDMFLWKQSRGDMSVLMKYLKEESCQFENVDSLMDVSHRIAIVSAEPGMGKSTLLTHLELGTKQGHPAMWVVRINLKDFTEQLDKLPPNFKLQEEIEFLLQASGIAAKWKPMFRSKLATMENVCVMFDGYDEISPTHSEKVTRILKFLLATKLQKLWVTTRPVMRNELESELSTLALTLQPFSKSDQRNFLTKYFKKSIAQIEETLLNKFITDMLHLTATQLNDRDRELMGIPLQSMMLAEAFEKNLRTYSETSKLELPRTLDLLQLYDNFVDRKFEIFYEKIKVDMTNPGQIEVYNQWRETVQENHMLSALLVLLPRDELNFEGKVTTKSKIKNFFRSAALLRNKGKSAYQIEERVQPFLKKVSEGHERTGIIHAIMNSKPSFIHRTFAEYFAALWFARNFENLKSYLNEKLFDPNFQIVRKFFDLILAQKFSLHVAVLKQENGSVETLLEQEYDVNTRDKGGRTTLHLAVMSLAGAHDNDDKHDPSMRTLERIMEILLKNGADPGIKDEVLCWRPLRIAERIRAWSVVDMLMANGAHSSDLVLTRNNINNDEYVQDVLKAAARQGLVNLVKFMLEHGLRVGHPIVVEYELFFGRHESEATLLHESSRHGHVELVQFLLDKKADINAEDKEYKRTALMWAAGAGQQEVVEFLIQRGASVTSRDTSGNTALLVAAGHRQWVVFRLLSQQKDTDLTTCNNEGYNALHIAARYGSAVMVAQLLDTGRFYIECRNKVQVTPLLLAAWSGQLEVTQLLFERGADINLHDILGYTPLHDAAEKDHLQIVQFLVKNGASLTARNKNGKTPLDLALMKGNSDVAEFLRNVTR